MIFIALGQMKQNRKGKTEKSEKPNKAKSIPVRLADVLTWRSHF